MKQTDIKSAISFEDKVLTLPEIDKNIVIAELA